MLAHKRHSLGAVPFRRPGLAANFVPVAINEERGRQTRRIDLARRSAGLVEKDAERYEAELVIKLLHGWKPLPVERQRQHDELRRIVVGLKPVEGRHLFPAGCTPGRPDVEKNRLAFEVRKGARAAIAIDEAQFGHWTRL